jgi:hypothetical protein
MAKSRHEAKRQKIGVQEAQRQPERQRIADTRSRGEAGKNKPNVKPTAKRLTTTRVLGEGEEQTPSKDRHRPSPSRKTTRHNVNILTPSLDWAQLPTPQRGYWLPTRHIRICGYADTKRVKRGGKSWRYMAPAPQSHALFTIYNPHIPANTNYQLGHQL